MKKIALLASVAVLLTMAGAVLSQRKKDVVGPRPKTAEQPPRDVCGPNRHVVEIREADPAIDKIHHDRMRDLFITKAYQPDTTILLGPNVVLDFSELGARDPTIEVTPDNVPIGLPIKLNRCVTIRSVAWFGPSPNDVSVRTDGVVLVRDIPAPASSRKAAQTVGQKSSRGGTAPPSGNLPDTVINEPSAPRPVPEARSSMALGPVLKFGPHRRSGDLTFLEARCFVGVPDQADHIRISGFRIHGPDFGQQTVGDKGIVINKCIDVVRR
jgi:hypothetical protein